MKIKLYLLTVLIQLLGAVGYATVPKLINYQGRLTDSNGQPTDANVTITLRIYDAETTGQLTYSENVGTVEVKNGTYSFQFGSSGSSTRNATETFGPTDGVAQVFNHTASNTPMLTGSASISDGNATWTEGASNATLTGNITHSSGVVSAVYLSGVPASGKTLKLRYDYNATSIAGALLDNNESWMEVVIDGLAYSPRKQLVAMPFALIANEALSVSGKINESQLNASDSSSDIMMMIASLQGQVSRLRASINSGKSEEDADLIIPQHDWIFSENFTDSNGNLNSVVTADTNATYSSQLRSYVSGSSDFSNDGQISNNSGNRFNLTWRLYATFNINAFVNYHTSNATNHVKQKLNFIYNDSSSEYSLERTNVNSGTQYYLNPRPEKLVSQIELWGYSEHGSTSLNRTYVPLGYGETVKIKLNLPEQSKTVVATRVDVLGQVLNSSTNYYDLSDGSGTSSGLSLSKKNDYGEDQNPNSLTLHLNCLRVSSVTVRYWFKD